MLMSVDPGISGTGFCIWSNRANANLMLAGVLTSKEKLWDKKGYEIARHIKRNVIQFNVEEVAIEFPAFFGSVGGEMVARRGDLVKLTWMVGVLSGILYDEARITLVPVNQWKGQLPKEVVNDRIKKILTSKECSLLHSHSWDAAGIGLFIQGRI